MMSESRRVAALGMLFAWCGGLLIVRVLRAGTLAYAFLAWNLFLAFIPAVAARMLAWAHDGKRSIVFQISLAALWLAFLPNAPYIVTDLLHLRPRPPVPLWYDVALLLSFAATGLLVGYISLIDVQRVVTSRWGRLAARFCEAVALILCGFGIYLGRFLRWNSWEIITDPISLFRVIVDRVANPMAYPRAVAVTAVYGSGLLIGYVVFRILFADSAPHSRRQPVV